MAAAVRLSVSLLAIHTGPPIAAGMRGRQPTPSSKF